MRRADDASGHPGEPAPRRLEDGPDGPDPDADARGRQRVPIEVWLESDEGRIALEAFRPVPRPPW